MLRSLFSLSFLNLSEVVLCALFAPGQSSGAEPVPFTLQPAAITAGGPAFTLRVTGQGFTGTTRILLDGAAVATYVDSGTRLEADIPAWRIARPGPVAVAVSRDDKKASEALTLTINPPLEWIVPAILPAAPHTQFYAQALSISGGTPPVRFSLAFGVNPPGLQLDGYNGTIVGYASTLGRYELSVRTVDSTGATAAHRLQLAVSSELRIASGPSLPDAIAGQPYST